MYEFDGRQQVLPSEQVTRYVRDEEVLHPELQVPLATSEIFLTFFPGASLPARGPL